MKEHWFFTSVVVKRRETDTGERGKNEMEDERRKNRGKNTSNSNLQNEPLRAKVESSFTPR